MLLETFSSKFLSLICISCVLAVATALFALQHRTYTGSLPNLVKQHRDVVAVIVQILSNGLSILQMLVLCSLVNFASRIRLFRSPATLPDLGFWSALSTPRLDAALPWTRLLILCLAVSLGPSLGAIWSGGLTPIATTAVLSGGRIVKPDYPAGVDPTFSISDDGLINLACIRPADQYNPNVLDMTTCPALDLASALMASARTATSVHGPHLHTKLDNNDWTYIGRSYGVGSSQGLFKPTRLGQEGATGYSYMETGYITNVSCRATTTDPLNFKNYETDQSNALVYADTVTVGSKKISIPLYQLNIQYAGQPFFAWATCSGCLASNEHLMVTYDYGDWYSRFGSRLCSIAFQPTTFNISVSVTNSTMSVLPVVERAIFDPNGTLAQAVVMDLDLLSRTSSNIGVSTIGTAVLYNLLTVNATSPGLPSGRLDTLALEVFVESLLDDLLVARATEQMIIYQNHTAVVVEALFPAIMIGTPPFHYAQLIVSVLLTIVYIAEAVRTRFWADLPKFNFVETATLADAALGPAVRRKELSWSGALQPSTKKLEEARVQAVYTRDGVPRLQYQYAEAGSGFLGGGVATTFKGPYASVHQVDPI